jgi:hydrogenase expression/formation protein HypE
MTDDGPSCPLPFGGYDRIVLAHGGGGRVTQELIDGIFRPAFRNDELDRAHDGAVVQTGPHTAITTDAFTVQPLVFPGGNIGDLAICGTVNDLAMCGARPDYLSAAFVLEEGLELTVLKSIVDAMGRAAARAGIRVVTGDTKVVERGKGDGVFITTTGVGAVVASTPPDPRRIRPGDAILVSGPVGDHGVAVLSVREGIAFDTTLHSDVAAVAGDVLFLYEAGIDVHCLRDPTRGGLATALAELSAASGQGMLVEEAKVPVRPEVADACELLGLDPLYVASEGRCIAIVPEHDVTTALHFLGASTGGGAVRIGTVVAEHPGRVSLRSPTGRQRVLDIPSGEQLPRIC